MQSRILSRQLTRQRGWKSRGSCARRDLSLFRSRRPRLQRNRMPVAKPSKLDRPSGDPVRPALATAADAPERRMRRGGGKQEFGRMKRTLRKAERRAGDGAEIGGTGATILKFRGAPLARLVDKNRIGIEELQAADDIAIAFHAQAGAVK